MSEATRRPFRPGWSTSSSGRNGLVRAPAGVRSEAQAGAGRGARGQAGQRSRSVEGAARGAERAVAASRGVSVAGRSRAKRDVLRRVTLDLQGLAAQGGAADGPAPGRLTSDVEATGFDALAALVPKSGDGPSRGATGTSKVLSFASNRNSPRQVRRRGNDEARRERERAQAAAARRAVQDAERTLAGATRRHQGRSGDESRRRAAEGVGAREAKGRGRDGESRGCRRHGASGRAAHAE